MSLVGYDSDRPRGITYRLRALEEEVATLVRRVKHIEDSL